MHAPDGLYTHLNIQHLHMPEQPYVGTPGSCCVTWRRATGSGWRARWRRWSSRWWQVGSTAGALRSCIGSSLDGLYCPHAGWPSVHPMFALLCAEGGRRGKRGGKAGKAEQHDAAEELATARDQAAHATAEAEQLRQQVAELQAAAERQQAEAAETAAATAAAAAAASSSTEAEERLREAQQQAAAPRRRRRSLHRQHPHRLHRRLRLRRGRRVRRELDAACLGARLGRQRGGREPDAPGHCAGARGPGAGRHPQLPRRHGRHVPLHGRRAAGGAALRLRRAQGEEAGRGRDAQVLPERAALGRLHGGDVGVGDYATIGDM